MANSSTSTYAAQQSAYLDSLINYILDIKPYHTKLAASGAISEGYLFTDDVNVSLVETDNIEILLGADLMPATGVPGQGGYRARISQSWWHDILSDGSRATWPMPQITLPLLSSSATLQNFTCGTDDYTGFSGIILGAFDPKRFDGPGITNVQKNAVHQQDTIDYTLSHGSYAVQILSGGNWSELDIQNVTAFSAQSGALIYNTSTLSGGTITNITGGNYEEWTITCTYVDYSTSGFPAQASVVGSVSGNIGTAIFGETFSNPLISFLWTFAPGEDEETAVGPGNPAGAPVSVWTLTPFSKITVAAGAPQEVWSIIKSNPIALGGPVLFNNVPQAAGGPTIEIHTRSLNYVDAEQTWTIEFVGDGTYNLTGTGGSLTGYPVNVALINGCAYKDDNIAFTLIPTVSGWNAGDTFTWHVNPTNTGSNGLSPANFKVYGSVSGWQQDAKLGEWYWNGIIGFKIPGLDYFTGNQTINFTALKAVHSMAEPSTYTITFATATNGTTPGLATVYNNIYGYRAGMVQGEAWSDEFCSFQIDTPGHLTQYAVGDQLFVYLSPPATFAMSAGYERQPYEDVPYDAGSIDLTVPYLYDSELFPLFQNYGALVWHKSSGTGANCVVGDSIVIDKAFFDKVKFQITGAGTSHPELGIQTVGDGVTDWLPLEFRYYDSGTAASDGSITPTPPAAGAEAGYEPGRADFSDLATYIEAYSAANPNQRVFWITSPRFGKTDRAASSTLTFDPTFFATYLPFNTKYSLKVQPDESYGQTIRTKITENLQVYARIYLELAEGPMNDYWLYLYDFNTMTFNLANQTTPPLLYNFVTSISDTMHAMEIIEDVQYVDIVNATIVEGGALPVPPGYGDYPYDVDPYDQGFPNGIIPEVIETSPGVFEYTGNPLDFVIPFATTTPAIQLGIQPLVPIAPGVPYYEAVMADSPVMFIPGTDTGGSVYDIIRNQAVTPYGDMNVTYGEPGIASGQASVYLTSGAGIYVTNPFYGSTNIDFSLEMWFNSTSTLPTNSDAEYGPASGLNADINGYGNADYSMGFMGAMIPYFTTGWPGTGNDYTVGASNPNSYNDGNWHYAVATRDGNSGVMKMYVDNVLIATGTGYVGSLPGGSLLGTGFNAVGYNGYVSNLAIYNTVLTPSTIAAHFAAGFLPQVVGGNDNERTSSAIAEGLSIIVTATESGSAPPTPPVLQNEPFNADTGQFIHTSYNSDPSGTLTIGGGIGSYVVSNGGYSSSFYIDTNFPVTAASVFVSIDIVSLPEIGNEGGSYLSIDPGIYKDGENCIFVELGTSSGTEPSGMYFQIYEIRSGNKSAIGSGSDIFIANPHPTPFPTTFGLGFDGHLVRFYAKFSGTWVVVGEAFTGSVYTAGDLAGYYGGFSIWSNPGEGVPVEVTNLQFGPNYDPTTPPLASLLLHCDGTNGSTTFTDSSGNSIPVTASGTVQISTSNPKFGTGAASFSQNGALTMPVVSGGLLDLGTGDFTVEWFANPSPDVNGEGLMFQTSSNEINVYWNDGSQCLAGSFWGYGIPSTAGSIPVGLWTHVALVCQGGEFTTYVGGIGSALGAGNVQRSPQGGTISFGGPGLAFNGMMDEIRITPAALYTANFTPPTAPFTNTGPGGTFIYANEVFDFNLLEPTTWTGNPPESEGLLISTTATDYNITAINLPFDPTLHFPMFFVESSNNLGTYGTPSANFIYPPEAAGATSASYTFTLPGGFTAPFRLWIK
jgi:hypothetical protein